MGVFNLSTFLFTEKKKFFHRHLNSVFCKNQLSEEKIAKRTKNHLNLDLENIGTNVYKIKILSDPLLSRW